MKLWWTGLGLAGLLGLAACIDGPGDSHELLPGNFDAFVMNVQPELAASCANPSCHGTAGRPLEIYAPQQHRADPSRLHLDEALSEEELHDNHLRSGAFLIDLEQAADSALLTKPLARDAGGSDHSGGVQYPDVEEPGYRALLEWVRLEHSATKEWNE